MKDTLFELNISYVNPKRKFVFFGLLLLVLLINVGVIYIEPIAATLAMNNGLSYANPVIKVYNDQDNITASLEDITGIDLLGTYTCNTVDCSILNVDTTNEEVIIKDGEYLIFNYSTKTTTPLSIEVKDYQEIGVKENIIYLKDNDKYALFNIDNNAFVTEFIYDGITTNKINLGVDYKIGGYYQDSKYNQKVDLYDEYSNVIKKYNYCINLDGDSTGLCSEHVSGTITNQEVDKVIDIVLAQYPNLNADRLFLIKSAVEAVGLPYLWGGGHTTLEATMSTANSTWGNTQVYLSSGFRNQVAGNYYPDGLDCAGFVRWAYYIASGVDLYKDRVNVITGNNKDVTLIDKSQLLPGDIILDSDHVVIYLYTDESGLPISVHSSYSNLKVEVSNYKRGNTYYRLNNWLEQ